VSFSFVFCLSPISFAFPITHPPTPSFLAPNNVWLSSALLPVVESGGFSSELLAKTSGSATAPLLRFSRWAALPVNPFWRPTTADERDEHGEAYASHAVRGERRAKPVGSF